MKKDRILIVSNMYPSKKYPHYGVFVQHSMEVLKNVGYSIELCVMTKQDGKLAKLKEYFKFYLSVILKIWSGSYDLVYAHYASHTAIPLLIANFFKKVDIVMNVHGNDIVPETAEDEKYISLSRKILNRSIKIIAPSDYFKRVLMNEFGIEIDKISVYPSGGVDVSVFKKMDKRVALKKLNLSGRYRYIGYVSRIEENKGWDNFLLASASMVLNDSSIRLIIVGDGSQKTNCINLATELGINDFVIYYDLQLQTNLVYFYNCFDIFVFPTRRKSESLGLVGLEAMACETIVVLPDKYGPSSYAMDGYNSITFNPHDVSDLQRAIETAFYLDKVENISSRARETAIRYSNENTDSILQNLFFEITN